MKKNRGEALRYLWYGVLTSLVSYLSFWLLLRLLGDRRTLTANTLSFVLATLFAFLTNKYRVFHSRTKGIRALLREGAAFTGARLGSFAFEQAGLFAALRFFHADTVYVFGLQGTLLAKLALSFAATVLNYGLSKYLVFRAPSK